jgi:hypothetical protein
MTPIPDKRSLKYHSLTHAPVKIVLGYLPDSPRKLIKYFADSLLKQFTQEDASQLFRYVQVVG